MHHPEGDFVVSEGFDDGLFFCSFPSFCAELMFLLADSRTISSNVLMERR